MANRRKTRGDGASRDGRSKGRASKKNPFTKRELEHYRTLLLDRRERILRSVTSMEEEALKAAGQDFSVDHMADHGSDNFEQDLTLGLVESERKELTEIDRALGRIKEGTFGVCEGTGETIATARLEAIPYTRYSVEFQRRLEAGEVVEDDEA
jgi:RNA polymerase-binding protein DksA